MSDLTTFGALLRQKRRLRDLTREALARRAHCSASAIRRLEGGDLRASRELAQALAEALELNPTEMATFVALARGEVVAEPVVPAPPALEVLSVSNLPAPMTSLVGRRHEIAVVSELLCEEGVRLLTLTGPPGVGKTRLAIATATALQSQNDFPDGLFFVALADLFVPELVPAATAAALGVSERGESQLLSALKEWLRPRRVLLVFDNFEHVLTAAALLTELLSAAPGLKILATSREVLHLYGEHEYPVPPLGLPDVHRLPTRMTPANYNAFPALQLFKERARAVVPGFKLTHENAADVARICAWLDGLPLAIEMTAAHLRRYDLPTILTRLSDQLSILTGGPRDLSPRQQSMEGAIAWSYEMLDPQLQAIFAALSVLVGSYDSAAAQAIADPHGLFGREAFEDQLYRLVEKSLLRHVVASDGSHRYSMLVVMREFAFARLTEQGRVAEVQQRHAAHYSNVLEQARPFVKGGREQAVWLPRLEREYDNLRVALDWITGRPEHATLVLKMVVTLFPVWNTRGYYNEGRNWLERALSLGGAPEWRAKCLDCIGWIARMQGDPVAAQTALEEALALHTETGDEPGMATSLSHLAVLAGSEGDYQQAGALLIKALEIRRRVDEPVNLGPTLNNLGVVYLRTGEYEQAERCYRESEEICRAYGYETSLTHSLHGLAKVYRFQKRFGEAYELLKQVVTTRYKLNYRFELLTSLREVGELLFELGDHKQAARLAAAVDRWTTELGFQLQANAKAENAIHFAILRNTLGEAAFTNTWAEGVGLSIDEAVALAIKNEGVQGQVATRHYTP